MGATIREDFACRTSRAKPSTTPTATLCAGYKEMDDPLNLRSTALFSPTIPVSAPARLLGHHLNAAKSMYERLAKQIAEFEADLDATQEVGARFVAAPGEGIIHIEDASFWGPDMLIFHGRNAEGRKVQVLQHYSQLSITLTAVAATEPEPRRVGFVLLKKVDPAG
jgi:hypothetical protein